jgi:hypothetical protein
MKLRFALLWLVVATVLSAQVPRIGIIDYYGVRRVTPARILQALGVHEGDPLPSSKVATEEKLEAVPGVARALLEAVCCDSGKTVLFVGIEERLARHSEFRPEPEGDATLPQEILDAHRELQEAVQEAVRYGKVVEGFAEGHPLFSDMAANQVQKRFIGLAEENLSNLRKVLRSSSDADQRAIAAEVIGYAPKKRLVVDDLQYALQDPDAHVRGNAIRALRAIAVLAEKDPGFGIRVSPTWLVEMLNSIVWSDRTKALAALVDLTQSRKPEVLEQVRERAFDSVVEMARWRSLTHALPAYILLGRLGGLPEERIQATWAAGQRDATVDSIILQSKRTKK